VAEGEFRSTGILAAEILDEILEKPLVFACDGAQFAFGFTIVRAYWIGEGTRSAPNIWWQLDSKVLDFLA
jgi:hypothetical protein